MTLAKTDLPDGAVLATVLRLARRLDERVAERLAGLGGLPDARPAHVRVLPHLQGEGVRITDLGARLGVSKQAVGALCADLMDWGLAEQTADPRDGRARRVRLTAKGQQALTDGLGVLGELERDVSLALGPLRFAGLRAGARAAAGALEGP